MADTIDGPIVIRFDGLDAERHEIDLGLLGESLKGISRIIAISGNFAATGKYVQHRDALEVRVVVAEPQAKCFQLMAVVKWAAENPLISTIVGGLTVTLVSYIFAWASGQRQEMKLLHGALETAIKELGHRDEAVIDSLTRTIDKMADALRPAVRQAVLPIGQTAKTLTIGDSAGANRVVLGEAEKATIMSADRGEIQAETDYEVLITELDMETGNCKVSLLDESEDRFKGLITDPVVTAPNNLYVLAMAERAPLCIRAKVVVKDGEIDRFYISDAKRK